MPSDSTKETRYQYLLRVIPTCTPDKCELWPFGAGPYGYGRMSFRGVSRNVHTVAYYIKYGEWPLPTGRHTCDTPLCLNPFHIVPGTQAQNIADMMERGRHAKGEQAGRAALTPEQVKAARARYIPYKVTFVMLAKEFGVHPTTVRSAVINESWQHLRKEEANNGAN